MTFLDEINRIDALSQANANAEKSLALIRALKEGRVSLDEVMLTDNGWLVRAIQPSSERDAPLANDPLTNGERM